MYSDRAGVVRAKELDSEPNVRPSLTVAKLQVHQIQNSTFWQPKYIFIDAAFLKTLPMREFSNGMVEVVKVHLFTFTFHSFLLKQKTKRKTATIWNESDFASLKSRWAEIVATIETPSVNYLGHTKATHSMVQELLLSIIVGSISVKAHIVINDECKMTGLHNLVNFGHMIGHVIEAMLMPSILHSECISVGIILEGKVSRQLRHLRQVGVSCLIRCLKSYNLPVSLLDPHIVAMPASRLLGIDCLLDIMWIDKKNSGLEKKIVLLATIGKTVEQKASIVPNPIIGKTLTEAAKVVPRVPMKSPVRMATPRSKSISNRTLVLAALRSGTCRLRNLLHSDDTQVMMTALHELKVRAWPSHILSPLILHFSLSDRVRVSNGKMAETYPAQLYISRLSEITHTREELGQRASILL